MSSNQETVADIVTEIRAKAKHFEECSSLMVSESALALFLYPIADRLEAALKRERGNAAAMREAVEAVVRALSESNDIQSALLLMQAEAKCKAALAAPPKPLRNCDVPLVVDGPADNNADKAWLVFKKHNPNAYFDVSGLLRCIDWLLAPAEERKGCNDEK